MIRSSIFVFGHSLASAIAKCFAMAALATVVFSVLLFARRTVLKLNPLYSESSRAFVAPFVRIEGLAILAGLLEITIFLFLLSLLEALILRIAAFRAPYGISPASVFFLLTFALLSFTAIFYGIFEGDPDFIKSPAEPWLDISISLKFVARLTMLASIGFLLIETIVSILSWVRRSVWHE